jgi:hypothetical protein
MHSPRYSFPNDRRRLRRRLYSTKSGCYVFSTKTAGQSACLFFNRTDGEIGTVCPIGQITTHPLFESAGALTLRDVKQIVQNQFAIVPGIGSHDQSVTKSHAAGIFSDDTEASRGLRQFAILGRWDTIDNQNANARDILNSRHLRVHGVSLTKRCAAGKNQFFQRLCPFVGERQQMFECFRVNHGLQDFPVVKAASVRRKRLFL